MSEPFYILKHRQFFLWWYVRTFEDVGYTSITGEYHPVACISFSLDKREAASLTIGQVDLIKRNFHFHKWDAITASV